MRKLIYGINLTIDGCCDHTQTGGSEEILEYYTKLLQGVDLIVYGRKTYELMIPYWPDVLKDPTATKPEIEYARVFSAIDKVVFSKSLKSVEEKNATLLHSDLEAEIQKLKQQPGKNISVGGVDLPGQLMALGLIDEYYFVIHPIISGKGRRLLDGTDLQKKLNLKLAGSETLKSGCMALHYTK